jgi:hypothetical protein
MPLDITYTKLISGLVNLNTSRLSSDHSSEIHTLAKVKVEVCRVVEYHCFEDMTASEDSGSSIGGYIEG